MLIRLLGLKQVNFMSDTGDRVEGTTLYIAHPDPDVTGNYAGDVFVRKEIAIPQGIKPGDDLDMQFTKKGKLISIAATK